MTIQIISDDQIRGLNIHQQDIFDLILSGFQQHGRGDYENPPKQAIHTQPRAFMHAMPGCLPKLGLAGTKLISVYPDNPSKGIPSTTGIIVMLDPETGLSQFVLDAVWITKVRTAAVSMVTTKFLCQKKSPTFGIVGATGASGKAHLDAIRELYPDSHVLVNSRSEVNCKELIEENPEIQISFESSVEALTKSCDVLVACTSKLLQPIFMFKWLQEGQTVLNVHALGWPAEVMENVDLVTCDDRAQILDQTNGLTQMYPGLNPHVELGQIILGNHPGRESLNQKIMSFNYGLAIFDLMVAGDILKRLS